jgi:glutamate--cysteine ligase
MIATIHRKIRERQKELDRWFQERLGSVPPPVYSSVDIRHAGYKISVVDTNLFPAGFNNLCQSFAKQAAESFRRYFFRYGSAVSRVLIVPEGHTRNLHYWANIDAIQKILSQAGMQTILGRSSEMGIDLPPEIKLESGTILQLESIERQGRFLYVSGTRPDIVLLNNDFSRAFPQILSGLDQPVIPSPHLGWHRRQKSEHFQIYDRLIGEIAGIMDIDPWLLSPYMHRVKNVDLEDETSRVRLQDSVDALVRRIRLKHEEYRIDSEPYVFIKDNAGTYGMGITHVRDGEEILHLGRRKRNKLASSKGGHRVQDFFLQEGLPTVQFYQGKPLEPVVYLVGGESVGQFFRIHGEKSDRDNLNARGMSFDTLCSHSLKGPDDVIPIDCSAPDKLRIVSDLLARIASYAGSLELEAIETDLNQVVDI